MEISQYFSVNKTPIGTENFMNNPPMDKAALDQLKEKTVRLSVISNSGLILMKYIVGFAIGSVISEAIHSSMDLIAAVIAFFAVRKSAEPFSRSFRSS